MRHEDGRTVTPEQLEALVAWLGQRRSDQEIAFRPARVLMQDFTGVPAVVDLAAMRQAMLELGGDPQKINPLSPVDLVIDHSVQVDAFGRPGAFERNVELEYERNAERYAFLRWGASAFDNFRVVPPGTGICHQVNLEYLAQVVWTAPEGNREVAYPDTLVGTDSHTTMVNGLGVLGWGVGGIEAEAAMLGQPISMVIPEVVGFKLTGRLPEGATATDLVLTVTETLRKQGRGRQVRRVLRARPRPSAARRPRDDRQHGARVRRDLRHLPDRCADARVSPPDRARSRSASRWSRPTPRRRACGARATRPSRCSPRCWSSTSPPSSPRSPAPSGRRTGSRSRAPRRPSRRRCRACSARAATRQCACRSRASEGDLGHGDVVISAITSCTNTSNPGVMLGAGLLARNARKRGLKPKPYVKTSLAPGSRVVTDYLEKTGLMEDLRALGFDLVGYGCTTCIGNSGPLPEPVAQAIDEHQLVAAAVLSGNRNFEGRVHPQVKANYLASPPLVVAYALAGSLQGRPHQRAARHRQRRQAGLSARHLAEPGRRPGRDPERRQRRHVQKRLCRRLQGRRALGEDRRPGERGLRLGRRQHLRQAAALFRRT